MAVPREPITDAELDVLKLLWGGAPLTARELTEQLYGEPTAATIGTVQKLLQRLEAKNCVRRDRRRYVHRFTAKVSQTDVAGRQLELLARKVADGSLAPFITHLVQARRLSEDEKAQIRRLLEE
ncbi:MAG TPA: BlaI/MecI/CopY family transcriptional regulator [Planctomycetaceae bacterium]|nr:BlaI/MecI/CopY family transcriptional regulator [Planctomycetaceae bacterium]